MQRTYNPCILARNQWTQNKNAKIASTVCEKRLKPQSLLNVVRSSPQGESRLVEEVSLGPQSLNGARASAVWKLPNIIQCRRKSQRPRGNREKLAALVADLGTVKGAGWISWESRPQAYHNPAKVRLYVGVISTCYTILIPLWSHVDHTNHGNVCNAVNWRFRLS